MKRTTSIALLTISATLLGCESTQKAESIPATPLVPAEPSAEETTVAQAPPTPLAIGDDAPAISIDHWVKGDAIEGFEDGQVYVMEFWATWCGPCITTMPHLSGLQDKYGDTVKIIGVSSEKELVTVTNFLEETNKRDNLLNTDRMRYTVTVDPDRSTSRVFMEASGQRGIPTAFIINANGKVAWIGHPMNMDEPLEQVVNGTWDLAAATAEFKRTHGEDLAMKDLKTIYVEAIGNNDWDMWIAALDEFIGVHGNNPQIDSMKFDALLHGKKDIEGAYIWARTMLESSWDNAQALNAFAWNMLDGTPAELQDLTFALEVALRASELTNNEDAAILDTLARAYWELDETETAISWQEKAVEFSTEGAMADELRITLNRYSDTKEPAPVVVASIETTDEDESASVEEVVADHPSGDHPSADPTPEEIAMIPLVPLVPAVEETQVVDAPPAPLAIGDNAPEISIDHWVKGDAIDGFENGQVYVMEFWATWCGPCITSMPHLSGLQDKYGDTVKIIGVSSEKELETVTNFLDETNKADDLLNTDRMRYTVTVDPDRSTYRVFMEASGQRGIPTAFIINTDGKVAWIGHPMNMDEPLEQVVNGTWDLAAAGAEFAKEQAQNNAMNEMRSVYMAATENDEWDGWIAAIDSFTEEYGSNPQMNSMKFEALLTGKKDKEAAYEWARIMLAPSWDDANVLNAFAWNLLDETPAELQDLDYALIVATRASELTNNEDAMVLDTLARAYWEIGETYKAIAWQQKAVEFADGQMGESIAATLEQYETSLASVTND